MERQGLLKRVFDSAENTSMEVGKTTQLSVKTLRREISTKYFRNRLFCHIYILVRGISMETFIYVFFSLNLIISRCHIFSIWRMYDFTTNNMNSARFYEICQNGRPHGPLFWCCSFLQYLKTSESAMVLTWWCDMGLAVILKKNMHQSSV